MPMRFEVTRRARGSADRDAPALALDPRASRVILAVPGLEGLAGLVLAFVAITARVARTGSSPIMSPMGVVESKEGAQEASRLQTSEHPMRCSSCANAHGPVWWSPRAGDSLLTQGFFKDALALR